jgi:hypothetical protein
MTVLLLARFLLLAMLFGLATWLLSAAATGRD